jgi:hypothetical protein
MDREWTVLFAHDDTAAIIETRQPTTFEAAERTVRQLTAAGYRYAAVVRREVIDREVDARPVRPAR